MEQLTSRENALIKEYRKLCGSRKRREETGCFVLEGARLVLDAAESGIPLRTLLVSDDGARYPEAEKLAGMARRCFSIPNELAAYISETEHPQGIFCGGGDAEGRAADDAGGQLSAAGRAAGSRQPGDHSADGGGDGCDRGGAFGPLSRSFSPKVIRSTMGSGWRQKNRAGG